MPVSLTTPLSLYSIPLAWVTGFVPVAVKLVVIHKAIGYNNIQPRENTKRVVDDASVSRETAECVQRLDGAHQNGNETLPLWIGAVLAANLAGVPNKTLNIASAGFLLTRALYNVVYITQTTLHVSCFRSTLYFTSIGFPMYLLFKAAKTLRNASAN